MQWAAVQMARRELFQGRKKILWLMVRQAGREVRHQVVLAA
jgi:hypothetical protein